MALFCSVIATLLAVRQLNQTRLPAQQARAQKEQNLNNVGNLSEQEVLQAANADANRAKSVPNLARSGEVTASNSKRSEPLVQPQVGGDRSLDRREDLIELVDPAVHSVGGRWAKTDGSLSSPDAKRSKIQLPRAIGQKYRFHFEARRVGDGPDKSLHVGLPIGGGQVVVILDGKPDYTHGLNLIDGKRSYENQSTSTGEIFAQGKWAAFDCFVEAGSIVVNSAGRKVVDWHGAFSRLSLMERHSVPQKNVLFFGIVDSRYEIRNCYLLE